VTQEHPQSFEFGFYTTFGARAVQAKQGRGHVKCQMEETLRNHGSKLLCRSSLSKVALISCLASFGQMAVADVTELPQEIQDSLYNPALLDPGQPIGDSAYRDWKAPNSPPWKIGYASSYAGNSWRQGVINRLENEIIPKWKDLGMISEVVVTQSNLNDATQIQQMRQLVDSGVDAIILCCSNPTALNQTVKYAHDRGVPVFSMSGYLTSPYAVNASVNYAVTGNMVGKAVAEDIGGEGNVLVVEGIPGTSGSDAQDTGVKAALAEHEGINVVGSIAGMWTDQIAQAEIQRWLATNPGRVDAIAVQSAAEMGSISAMEQSGREMASVSVGGQMSALCYWRNNPELTSAAVQGWPPGSDFEMTWNVMMRTLQGQGPKIQTIFTEPTVLEYADVEKILDENCSTESTDWYEVPIEQWASKEFLDNYFLNPADPEAYDPASH